MKRMLGLGIVALVLAVAMAGPASAHKVSFHTKLKARGVIGPPYEIKGKVSSPRDACERNRTIKVFHKDANDTQQVGTERTNGRGKFTFTFGPEQPVPGDEWIVKLRKQVLRRGGGHRHVCPAPPALRQPAFLP